MFVKTIAVGMPLVLGGMYVSGALGGGYSRDVARSATEVAQALSDLDLTKQPGAPGTDPGRSGGVPSLFQLEQRSNELRWVVHNGDKVATTMIAVLTPLDATHTRVTARVERGDAPDDFVAPAFRSKGVTMGLFTMALEDELDTLTAPAAMGRAECDALFERLMVANMGGGVQRDPGTLSGSIAQTSTNVMKLAAVEAEARRQGCPSRGFDDTAPREQMVRSETPGVAPDNRPAGTFGSSADAVSFRPGQPMVRATPIGR